MAAPLRSGSEAGGETAEARTGLVTNRASATVLDTRRRSDWPGQYGFRSTVKHGWLEVRTHDLLLPALQHVTRQL